MDLSFLVTDTSSMNPMIRNEDENKFPISICGIF
jgi:hypothetical protein